VNFESELILRPKVLFRILDAAETYKLPKQLGIKELGMLSFILWI